MTRIFPAARGEDRAAAIFSLSCRVYRQQAKRSLRKQRRKLNATPLGDGRRLGSESDRMQSRRRRVTAGTRSYVRFLSRIPHRPCGQIGTFRAEFHDTSIPGKSLARYVAYLS
jgi:hypothetical protein